MSCARKGIEMKITKLKAKRNCWGDFDVDGGTRYLALCHQAIRRFFLLPKSAKVIFIEIHDRPAKDRLAIRIKEERNFWEEMAVKLHSLERKKAVLIYITGCQERWLKRRLKVGKTYFAELWYEEG